MGKKLKLNEQQHQAIISEILKETVEKLDKMESEGRLDEGFWDAINYALSKLGRYKAGGKIFGKGKVDQEYAAKIARIIDKEGNEMIRDLDAKIKETNPDFPNNYGSDKFLTTVLSIAAVYDSIVAATKKNPKEQGYISIDIANGIINDLREYVNKFLDVDLKSWFTGANENIEGYENGLMTEEYSISDEDMAKIDEEFGLNEQEPLDAADVRQQLQAKRTGGEDFQSTRMDTLKSNKLPMTLLGVGSALGAFSWLVNTDWFKSLFDVVSEKTDLEFIKTTVQTKSEIIGNVKPGDGLTQTLNIFNKAGLGPNSTPEQFLAQLKTLGGGNLQDGIEAITKQGGMMASPEEARQVLMDIAKNPHGHGDTLGEIFQGKLAGTGKSIGDTLVTVPGGELKGMIVKTLVQSIPKLVTRTAIKTGAGYAIAKGLGAILGPIGIGLVTAGALVKLFRMKGQKSSRAATLSDLYQSIRNIEGGIGLVEPKDEKATGGSQDNLYNGLKNLFQFIVNNKNTMGSGKYDTSNQTNAGDRFYQGGQIMKGGKRTAQKGGETQTGRERFFTNQGNVRENEEVVNEGKYITDKNVLQYLSKYMPFEKVKNFENLITRVEYLRNVLKKMGAETEDKVLNGFLKQLQTNPIMMTDFNTIFAVNPSNPQEVNSLLGMMKEILNNVYSNDYKFGTNMVDKMSTLGGGNINKLEEAPAYNSAEPNKSFQKDAQSKTTLKNNLVKFLQTAMSMFQYLHKQKTQKPQQKQNATQQAAPQQPVNESLNKELDRIKKIMFS